MAELDYWDALDRLRHAVDRGGCVDHLAEANARQRFVFGLLAQRRVRVRAEAVAVFRYLAATERMDDSKAEAIHLLGDSQE